MPRTKYIADNISNTLDFYGQFVLNTHGPYPGNPAALSIRNEVSGAGIRIVDWSSLAFPVNEFGDNYDNYIAVMTSGAKIDICNLLAGVNIGNTIPGSTVGGGGVKIYGTYGGGIWNYVGSSNGFVIQDLGPSIGHGGFLVNFQYTANINLMTAGFSNYQSGTGIRIANYNTNDIEIRNQGVGGVDTFRLVNSTTNGRLVIRNESTASGGVFISTTSYGRIELNCNAVTQGGVAINNTNDGNIYIRCSSAVNGGVTIENANDGRLHLTNTATTGSYGILIDNYNAGQVGIYNNASTDGGITVQNNNNGAIEIIQTANALLRLAQAGTGPLAIHQSGTGSLTILNSSNLDNTTGIYIQNDGSGGIEIKNTTNAGVIDIKNTGDGTGHIFITTHGGKIYMENDQYGIWGFGLTNRYLASDKLIWWSETWTQYIRNTSGLNIITQNFIVDGQLDSAGYYTDARFKNLQYFLIETSASNGGAILIEQKYNSTLTMKASATGSTIIIDSDAGITMTNNASGNIVITNSAGYISLTPNTGSSVNLNGQQKRTAVSITSAASPYSTTDEYYILADTSGGVITINLPIAVAGLVYKIKNSDTTSAGNAVTVTPASGNIDGNANFALNALESIEIVCDGTNWWII